jgi:Uma2 family endonuclease
MDIELEQVHRLTLDEYHQLIESGGLDEDTRVELIDGLIVDMSPKTPEHERPIRWLNRWLVSNVDHDRYEVGVGTPLTLEHSEPEPDFVVFARDAPQPYHPATAALVIEVSVSSIRRDLLVKPRLYAAAEVDEYWVIDVDARRVLCHRDPGPDGFGEVTDIPADGRLTATSVELPQLELAELFAAVGDPR